MMRWLIFGLTFFPIGCFNGVMLRPVHVNGPLQETLISESQHRLCWKKVALIDVDGLIMNARTSGIFGDGENPTSMFREKLEMAANDPLVKAVVIRINSPGGAVTASDIMYQDLITFRRCTHKPVVACMMDVAASGGYYIAMGCDKVYAHPTTVTGSIGVIMSLYNAQGLLTKLGVSSDPIKSGPNKDLGNPARAMTEEERAILQGMVTTFYDQFVQVVVRGRNLPEERVRVLADGRIYSGLEAKEKGLVDEIGYLDDAIEDAICLAHIKDARVVAYDRCEGYRGSIYAGMPKIPSQINVKLDVPGIAGPTSSTFMYLWEPGVVK